MKSLFDVILAHPKLVLAVDKPGGELLAPLAIVQFGGLISHAWRSC